MVPLGLFRVAVYLVSLSAMGIVAVVAAAAGGAMLRELLG
jgi:hypothetical protein